MRGLVRIFYRKGNSVKRSGPFSERRTLKTEKLLSSSPSPEKIAAISSYLGQREGTNLLREGGRDLLNTQPFAQKTLTPRGGLWTQKSWWAFRAPKKKISPPPPSPQTFPQRPSLSRASSSDNPPPFPLFLLKPAPSSDASSLPSAQEQEKKKIRNVHQEVNLRAWLKGLIKKH